MSDLPQPLDSNDDELQQALAAFGDGAMDLLFNDDDPSDELLVCNEDEPEAVATVEEVETESADLDSSEIRQIGITENDSSLIRYTKELANAIYCGHSMPHQEVRNNRTVLGEDRCLVFSVGQQPFALPLQTVREIVRRPVVTSLPRTPAWLRGVTNVRGQIVSVIDLRYLLDLETDSNQGATEKAILVHNETTKQITSLFVDRILGIRSLREQLFDLSELDSQLASIAASVANIDAGEVVLIDSNKLFESADLTAFTNQAIQKT